MKILATLVVLAAIGFFGWLAAGGLDVAADSPHSMIVFKAIGFARERALDERAEDLRGPPLEDPKQIATGAAQNADTCEGCHLGPGIADNEFRRGLYPKPPDFSAQRIDEPAEAFWAIKHGLKMTAMPAWGLTHGDATIWAIVAFLRKLPDMSPAQYKQITAAAAAAEHAVDAPVEHPQAER